MNHCRHFIFIIAAAVFLTGCASTQQSYRDGYTQCGLASYYGWEQGRQTASGERFNPHLLTAAHRHLPFGTIVRVTNRQNGDCVDVRINDRGPFTGDRIIDVTTAAADILHMKQSGVVQVEIEVLSVGNGSYRKSS